MLGVETPEPDAAGHTELERHALQAQLWARAHHEAAQAVVGTVLGARVTDVEIWSGPPIGGRVGITGLEDEASGPSEHLLVRRCVYLLAGPVAEQIAAGGDGAILNEAAARAAMVLLDGVRDPATIDLDTELGTAAGLIQSHFGLDGEAAATAAIDHLSLAVETALRDRWIAIQSIAVSLLRHGKLTEEQVQAVFAVAMPAPASADLLSLLALPPEG
jgi:hypothetical protein